jgi:hypothetical protein
VEPQERRTAHAPPANDATNRRRHAMRLLRDEHDAIVLVYELTGLLASDPRLLVFEWEGGRSISRSDSYPPNWRELKDSTLLELRRQEA